MEKWKYDLSPIFYPRSIALVGASDEPGSWSDMIYKNICQSGFGSRVFPVHPKKGSVWGLPCHKYIDRIDSEVDFAILLIPSRFIVEALGQCAKRKVKAALILASGFGEVTGGDGPEIQRQIRLVAEQSQIRLIGPNCLGSISFLGGLICYAGIIPDPITPGSFGFVSQSGGVANGILATTQERGLGMSYLVSSGNEAVLDASDFIKFMIDDPNTKVIGAFIEGFKNPRKFLCIADLALQTEKPLIVMKVGRSEKARTMALFHTGSLVGDEEVQDALFHQKGIIRVDTIDEMVETAQLFCYQRPARAKGVAVMTLSGGFCGMVSDYCKDLEITLPELSDRAREEITKAIPPFGIVNNPLDSTGQARINLEISHRCIDMLLAEENIDIVLFAVPSLVNLTQTSLQKIMEYLAEKGESSKKLVGVLSMITESLSPKKLEYHRRNSFPILQGGHRALLAIRHLFFYNRCLELFKKSMEVIDGFNSKIVPEICSSEINGRLNVFESLRILEKIGIHTPECALANSLEEVMEAARKMYYPLALRVNSISRIKSDSLNFCNIQNVIELDEAFAKIVNRMEKYSGEFDGFIVQKMAPEGIDMIIKVLIDEQFGPGITLEMGGLLEGALEDRTIRMAPIHHEDAQEMIKGLAAHRLLKSNQGQPGADTKALGEILIKASTLVLTLKDKLKSMEINPIRVFKAGKGAWALNAYFEFK